MTYFGAVLHLLEYTNKSTCGPDWIWTRNRGRLEQLHKRSTPTLLPLHAVFSSSSETHLHWKVQQGSQNSFQRETWVGSRQAAYVVQTRPLEPAQVILWPEACTGRKCCSLRQRSWSASTRPLSPDTDCQSSAFESASSLLDSSLESWHR